MVKAAKKDYFPPSVQKKKPALGETAGVVVWIDFVDETSHARSI
jgi:hypothetical protein